MKSFFTFNMNNEDDKHDFLLMSNTTNMYLVLTDIKNFLRNKLKHEALTEEKNKIYENLQNKFYESLDNYTIKNIID